MRMKRDQELETSFWASSGSAENVSLGIKRCQMH